MIHYRPGLGSASWITTIVKYETFFFGNTSNLCTSTVLPSIWTRFGDLQFLVPTKSEMESGKEERNVNNKITKNKNSTKLICKDSTNNLEDAEKNKIAVELMICKVSILVHHQIQIDFIFAVLIHRAGSDQYFPTVLTSVRPNQGPNETKLDKQYRWHQ